MGEVFWIGLGGAAGTLARYGVFRLFSGTTTGILAANVTGSFVLGFLVGAYGDRLDPTVSLALSVGVLGGYTTFSTWMVDSVHLWRSGALGAAALNVTTALVAGLVAAGMGVTLGLLFERTRLAA